MGVVTEVFTAVCRCMVARSQSPTLALLDLRQPVEWHLLGYPRQVQLQERQGSSGGR